MTEQAVVGVGNQIMRDDGLGAAVIDELREQGLQEHPSVTLDQAGTTAFFALEAMDGADRAVVVDALRVTGSDPGDLHRMTYSDGAFEDLDPQIHMHDFSFVDALEAGAGTYDLPEEIVVLGMTPEATTAGLGLSETVAERLPALVELVLDELATGGMDIEHWDVGKPAP
ncbi:MAG: hydrogenase maturation protease [Halodesulfurarchaeum sp.]